jgi:hypothetical protein
MKTTIETIRVPMMNGESVPHEVLSFDCAGHRLSVRKINDGLCYVLHRATGLKITGEYTGDRKEAAEGFADAVAVGAYDLSRLATVAATSPQINTYRTELTPIGEQYIIPGTERQDRPKTAQLSLF